MALKQHLPEGCEYIASDIIEREPGMVVCDLDAEDLPPLPEVDVAVLSGVLEYIKDVPKAVNHIGKSCRTMIASYAVGAGTGGQRGDGWINDYSEAQFIAMFAKSGFTLAERKTWSGQIVCKFEKGV